MRRILLSLITLISLQLAQGAVTKVDDLYYILNSTNKTAEVTYSTSSSPNTANHSYPGLTSVSIPSTIVVDNITYSVTSIGGSAFWYSSVKNVTIPNSVTSIREYAFRGCSGLISVTIPNSVTSIGVNAFNGCSGLTSVTIPNSVTSIEQYTFRYCTGLTSVTIPNSVTSIEYSAFGYCSSLTSVTIPNSVTSIRDRAFEFCSGLKSVTIGNSVKEISNYAFYACHGLIKYAYPDNLANPFDSGVAVSYPSKSKVKTIIEDGFIFSTDKKAIYFAPMELSGYYDLPNTINTIGSNAFYACDQLEEINIPGTVTSIGTDAFKGTTSLKDITFQRGDGEIKLSSTFVDSPISNLFLGRDIKGMIGVGTSLESLSVGSNVTYIDDNQFKGCSNLTNVKIFEGNLQTIGKSAFEGCACLTKMEIPNTVESIKSGAFKNCKALETVNLSSKLTEISDETFHYCTSLFSIKLPDGITSIGDSSFGSCHKLDNINLPEWLTRIGDSAFAACGFRNLTLPPNLKSIGNYAFGNCEELISIDIPNSVTSLGESAFFDCAVLEEATLSINLTSIQSGTFSGCNLQQIIIPDKVTEIGYEAFDGNNLQRIELPASLITIGDKAFYHAGPVDEITIPANVTKIGKQAFDGCDNLITVNSLNSMPPTCADATAFSQSTYKNAVLWVPAPSVEDYMTFVGWKEFKNYDALEAISSIKLTGPSNILRINKTMDLEATVVPSNISAGNLKWSSSNPIVATVDNYGRVKALSPGYVVITAKSQDIIATEGTYELTIMDYLLGDSNESDDVTITDAVNIASYVMGEDPAVFNFYASDVNQSNDITLADASGVISIILDSTYAALANSARRIKTADNDVLRADDFSIHYGETANVPVSLESDIDYVALQADVTATNGLTISDVLPSECLDYTHLFITKRLADDSVRIIIYSPALNEIPYNGNSLFDVVVGGNPGEGASINITNILATDTNLEEHQIGFEGGNCESLSTGIADINVTPAVKTETGMVIVDDAEGQAVTIYSVNGMVVASTKVARNEERYSLAPGAYIVTVGLHVEKVIVR